MRSEAHCFVEKVKIDELPIYFKYKEYDVKITPDNSNGREGLCLEISKKINISDVEYKEGDKDERGIFIEKKLRPYKEILTEIAHLIEGYLAIMYLYEPPRFRIEQVVVNTIPETPEEEKLVRDGTVSGGFGDIFKSPQYPLYKWSDKIIPSINKGMQHLASFSFLSQALRSQKRGDQEVAFFLYFRIIEGYFSDGTKDIEMALIKNKNDLEKYITYNNEIKQTTKNILSQLKLPSKSETSFEGLISDLVLIRHKLTHFSKTNTERHHTASINFELIPLNNIMRRACTLTLRDLIEI